MLKGGKPISEWLNDRAHLKGNVALLAAYTGVTASAIYAYCDNDDRDIRVLMNNKKPEIYECKKLSK